MPVSVRFSARPALATSRVAPLVARSLKAAFGTSLPASAVSFVSVEQLADETIVIIECESAVADNVEAAVVLGGGADRVAVAIEARASSAAELPPRASSPRKRLVPSTQLAAELW
ncbi:hypothetical protein M885DRAFT_615763 [Pelagophyceae sp. CCMP2097]|nr:hypothetical protein M885DRAFT_615763 [Pelagophyceae sp. CCMP2097]|mmetsp:Transcript_6105/g.19557  ORF Transcript_6105/g.19557 Transcript_6105/m.19557 type:complete len:115 (+) Transcript_6105:222-566(+)